MYNKSIEGDTMFYTYFLLFFIYSVLGWLIEVILSFFTEHKFINRGFLLGPYCPIYGCGILILTIFLSKYQSETGVLFALTFLICSILEYSTSWLMEKIFKLRWWDYTQMKFNINGRICLETMIPFSIIGVLAVKYVNPFLISVINSIPKTAIVILTIILFSIYLIDNMISFNIIFNLKQATQNIRKDSTEEIRKAIKKFTNNNLNLYYRIIKAFPDMTKIIQEQKDKYKNKKKKRKK